MSHKKIPPTAGKVTTTRCVGFDGREGTLRTLICSDGGIVIVFNPDKKSKTTTRKAK